MKTSFEDSLLSSIQQRHLATTVPALEEIKEEELHFFSSLSNNEELPMVAQSKNEEYLFKDHRNSQQQMSVQQQNQLIPNEYEINQEQQTSRRQKKKLSRLILKLIMDNNPINRQNLFKQYVAASGEHIHNDVAKKKIKRRFDEILLVLKGAQIVRQNKKIFSVVQATKQLSQYKQVFPQNMKKMEEKNEQKQQQIEMLKKKIQVSKAYFQNLKKRKDDSQRRIQFPIISVISRDQLVCINNYKSNSKNKGQEHQVSIRGQFQFQDQLQLLQFLNLQLVSKEEIKY